MVSSIIETELKRKNESHCTRSSETCCKDNHGRNGYGLDRVSMDKNAPAQPDCLANKLDGNWRAIGGRRYRLGPSHDLNEYSIFYIGPESPGLTNIVLVHSKNAVCA